MDLEQVKNMEIMMDGIKMGKQGEGDASTIPNAKAASESLAGVQSICQRRTSCSTRSCCFGAVGRWRDFVLWRASSARSTSVLGEVIVCEVIVFFRV